jgi:hypothetical protein
MPREMTVWEQEPSDAPRHGARGRFITRLAQMDAEGGSTALFGSRGEQR